MPILSLNGQLCWQKIYLYYFGPVVGELAFCCLAVEKQANLAEGAGAMLRLQVY